MAEFDLIAKYFAPLSADAAGAMDLKDDAAVIPPTPNREQAITSDCLVCGVHFRQLDPPETVARKTLGVNLSDLASMGAAPRFYTLAAAWPVGIDENWIKTFADGLEAMQRDHGVTLVGGDTVATPGPLSLTVTAFGDVVKGQALTRSGASPGEDLYVSGTVGDAALGLISLTRGIEGLTKDQTNFLRDRYQVPQPQVKLGQRLAGLATAAIDISDGLLADLGHVLTESGAHARVFVDNIPLSPAGSQAARHSDELFDLVLGGGDDYELLFTAQIDRRDDLAALSEELGVAISRIGVITKQDAGTPIVLERAGGVRVHRPQVTGYRHF